MLRVGLTGGIASGKSVVLARLAAAGLDTLDLDLVAHELMAPGGAAYRPVVEAFGPQILDAAGRVHRPSLAALVFADPAARTRLDAIVHPRVREEEDRRAARLAAAGASVVVTDAALLVEAGLHLRFHRLLVLHCSPEQQILRLRARGLPEAAARQRLAAQMPGGEKRRFGHWVIDTSGALEDTRARAEALEAELRDTARALPRPSPPALPVAAACLAGDRDETRLSARRLAEGISEDGGIVLGRLHARLAPDSTGAWWQVAADPAISSRLAATWAGPLVVWTLARVGDDPPYLLGAVASVSRLAGAPPGAAADACLFARTLLHVVAAESEADTEAWVADAERWAGAPPSMGFVGLAGWTAAGSGELGGAPDGLEPLARLVVNVSARANSVQDEHALSSASALLATAAVS